MSIPVDVNDLARTLTDFATGYLLSTTEGQVKVVSIAPELVDGVLLVRGPGRGSCANAAANPVVTALFPPLVAPGFSLLIDGTASVDGEDLQITPTSAVLHQAAR